jgi:hypothetical protein
MIKRFCRLAFRLTVFISLFVAATTSARSQSRGDLAVNEQVLQLAHRGKHAEAVTIAFSALAAAERQFGPDDPHLILPSYLCS